MLVYQRVFFDTVSQDVHVFSRGFAHDPTPSFTTISNFKYCVPWENVDIASPCKAVSSQACSETEVPWSQAGQTWAGAVVHIASNSQIRREAFVC